MFEHLNHKKYGFEVAKNKTLVLSQTAFSQECGNLTVSSSQHHHHQFLSLVAFYGGLPPGVTKDLAVKSIGQGNSLVSISRRMILVDPVCDYHACNGSDSDYYLCTVGGWQYEGHTDASHRVLLPEVLRLRGDWGREG